MTAFAVSLGGLAGSTVIQFAMLDAPDSLTTAGDTGDEPGLAAATSLLIYSRTLAGGGGLR